MTAQPADTKFPPVDTATRLPVDPALPALAALRAKGLAAIPALGLDDRAATFVVCAYSPGEQATIEVRVQGPGGGHFAVKAVAGDTSVEASLYEQFADAGLTSGPGVRVPPLLAEDRDLRALVVGWLEGRPLTDLIKEGQPERAGELAARWTRAAASLPIRLGRPFGTQRVLDGLEPSVAMLETGGAALGAAARGLAEWLARTRPPESAEHLVHGALYLRQFLDVGGDGGPGIIDWDHFGQGALELDAGMFLATLWRRALLHPRHERAAVRVEEAFRADTNGLLDERLLSWYEAAALVRLGGRMLRRRLSMHAIPLLARAAQLAEAAQ